MKKKSQIPPFSVPSAKAPAMFRPARVVDGSRLYVVFYATAPDGTLQRFRKRCEPEGYTRRERRRFADDYALRINDRLRAGWSPWDDVGLAPGDLPLVMVIDNYLALKRKETRLSSYKTTAGIVGRLRAFVVGDLSPGTLASGFSPIDAMRFADRLSGESIGPARHNQIIQAARSVFAYAIERGMLRDNPFQHVRRRKQATKNRRLFEGDELDRFWAWAEQYSPWYHLAALLTYRCFIRPKELLGLRVGDVDTAQGFVHVRADNAKTGKTRRSVLPRDVWDRVRAIGLEDHPPGLYLFSGRRFIPGKTASGKGRLGEHFSKRIRPALGFDSRLVYYSLKDTGITHFLQAGGSIGDAQLQAGHSSSEMLSKYIGTNKESIQALRSFGVDPGKRKAPE